MLKNIFNFSFSNKSCSLVDVTGSLVENSFDGDKDDEPHKGFTDDCDESQSYEILDGSVIMSPGKNFQSDDGNVIDETVKSNKEELSETKYVFFGVYFITYCLEFYFTFQRLATRFNQHG